LIVERHVVPSPVEPRDRDAERWQQGFEMEEEEVIAGRVAGRMDADDRGERAGALR
jgi:hypothetical protein